MPVLLDRGASGLSVLGARGLSPADLIPACSVDIALINNMPDSALESTERHFTQLLAAASGDVVVRVRQFSLPETHRSPTAEKYLRNTCSSLTDLLESQSDGLIVTGAEPRTVTLTGEPYWEAMTQVVDWARHNTLSAIWSCLAAHVAVLHTDGIHRRALPEKRSGIFEFSAAFEHPLFAGLLPTLSFPHSRRNGLSGDELAACGYTILSHSDRVGVDTFVRRDGSSSFLFFQGHPEYESDTLYREYRRDVVRYIKGESDIYPSTPENYFTPAARDRLIAFRARVLASRHESLALDFPMAESVMRNTWRATATRIYRNWLAGIVAEKSPRAGATRPVLRRPSADSFDLMTTQEESSSTDTSLSRLPLRSEAQQPSNEQPYDTAMAGRKPRAP